MIGYTAAPKAWGLTRGMGRVLGVDLARAVTDGWLTHAELGQLVARCQSCGRDCQCLPWLAERTSAEHLPGYCANGPALEALRP